MSFRPLRPDVVPTSTTGCRSGLYDRMSFRPLRRMMNMPLFCRRGRLAVEVGLRVHRFVDLIEQRHGRDDAGGARFGLAPFTDGCHELDVLAVEGEGVVVELDL